MQNRYEILANVEDEDTFLEPSLPVKRGPGRPPGTKNKISLDSTKRRPGRPPKNFEVGSLSRTEKQITINTNTNTDVDIVEEFADELLVVLQKKRTQLVSDMESVDRKISLLVARAKSISDSNEQSS